MNTSVRRPDLAGLALLALGLACLALAVWLETGPRALVLVPAVVASTIGAGHITKREARRDR